MTPTALLSLLVSGQSAVMSKLSDQHFATTVFGNHFAIVFQGHRGGYVT